MPVSMPPFDTWLHAFEFLAQQIGDRRFVLVFDEFPYAAQANSALPSALQIAIDHTFKNTKLTLILCGSNQGFMEHEVLGEKSPLYGRRTQQIQLKPFDYADAALMMPDCPPTERVSYYAAFGGTPYYLSSIDTSLDYAQNVAASFFSRSGLMFDEPSMLMRQELREPAAYASIMRAISAGANKSNEIAGKAGIPATAITGYLKTLMALDLIERVVPLGESEKSRRSLYQIKDPAFLFWYRFVAPFVTAVESGVGEQTAHRLLASDRRAEYEGHLFERVCREWLLRAARNGTLPLQVTNVGSWWGPDLVKRERTDIDVVAIDQIDRRALLGECKWRNEIDEAAVLSTLVDRRRLIPGYEDYWLYVFTKRRVGAKSLARAEELGHARYVSVDEMF